jgi:hypothetical protein
MAVIFTKCTCRTTGFCTHIALLDSARGRMRLVKTSTFRLKSPPRRATCSLERGYDDRDMAV